MLYFLLNLGGKHLYQNLKVVNDKMFFYSRVQKLFQ